MGASHNVPFAQIMPIKAAGSLRPNEASCKIRKRSCYLFMRVRKSFLRSNPMTRGYGLRMNADECGAQPQLAQSAR
jgi:hypothetical protein